MGRRDRSHSKGSVEMNGDTFSDSQLKARFKKSLSDAKFGDLAPEDVATGISAIHQLSKVVQFVHIYHSEIENVEGIYNLGIEQHAETERLTAMVDDLVIRRTKETKKLEDENEKYRDSLDRFKEDKQKLEMEKANLNRIRTNLEADIQVLKEEEIEAAIKRTSNNYEAKIKRMESKFEARIKILEAEKDELKSKAAQLQKDRDDQKDKFKLEKENLKLEKRSSQAYAKGLETELSQVKALAIARPRPYQFYVDAFHQLFDIIREVAWNEFEIMPEDAKSLDNDAVREELCKASEIFKYPLLSSESEVSTFLRACAIQNFISSTVMSVIQRPYFAEILTNREHQARVQAIDTLLDAISENHPTNCSQELTWHLTTVDKLDRLSSYNRSAASSISTKPEEPMIVQAILSQLQYLRNPDQQQAQVKLRAIAKQAIDLWSAIRKDRCKINFDYSPSTSDWDFVTYNMKDSQDDDSMGIKISNDKMPKTSYVLFPRITGIFESENGTAQVLHEGVALHYDSPAFQGGLEEIERIRAFERDLRKRAGSQSSPRISHRQTTWPTQHAGFE